MDSSTSQRPSRSAAVRAEFDKILMHHVSSLIDTRDDIAALPFNLATIACLLQVAERENEIKSFPSSPPERYNRETFLSDIEEIGLDLDEDAMQAIQLLEHYGFVVVNAQAQYTARESASLLITVLDAIFPQMPGMNLVAYVSQAIEEVLSGRKEQNRALQQFDQTLLKQGVHLSAIPEDKLSASVHRRILVHELPDPQVLLERRAAYLQRLQALRAKSLTSDAAPAVVTGHTRLKHVEIKELFPRKKAASEPEVAPDETMPGEAGPETMQDTVTPVPETSPPDLSASGTGSQDQFPEIDNGPTGPASDTVTSFLEADEVETASAESVLEEDPSEKFETEGDANKSLSKEEIIERKIRQFEEELAMPCPICSIGKILSATTEKGKTYYYCSNEDCRLISWGKPYHMECPVCKNPFLIEVPGADGQIGLKCPRATCLYRKKSTVAALSGEANAPAKRKVAVVKKKRKGVRRVVRRKSG